MPRQVITKVTGLKVTLTEKTGGSFLSSQRCLKSWDRKQEKNTKTAGMGNNSEEVRNRPWCSKQA